jgi:hypothetical protein
MNTTDRNVFLMIVILSVILFPVIAGIIGLFVETNTDDLPENIDFSMICSFPTDCISSISVWQMTVILWCGMSMFALFVVYLGGRSKAKRFNDRTIGLIKSLEIVCTEAALFRAAFNFLFYDPYPNHLRSHFS